MPKKVRKKQTTIDTETERQRNNKYIVRETWKGNINEKAGNGCMNVIEARSHNHFCRSKAVSIKYCAV